MRTYILDRDLGKIPHMMTQQDQIKQTREAAQVLAFTLGADSLEGGIQDSLPAVAMWAEYPYALMAYFETFVTATYNKVTPVQTKIWQHLIEDGWNLLLHDAPAGVAFELVNPLETVATPAMFTSHLTALIATDPKSYCPMYPDVQDLSVEYMEYWG